MTKTIDELRKKIASDQYAEGKSGLSDRMAGYNDGIQSAINYIDFNRDALEAGTLGIENQFIGYLFSYLEKRINELHKQVDDYDLKDVNDRINRISAIGAEAELTRLLGSLHKQAEEIKLSISPVLRMTTEFKEPTDEQDDTGRT